MLINNWYVACLSTDISAEKPFGTKMLGCDFVLYREPGGQAVCLSNVCCHRGAALCGGNIVNGAVACPYHGWEFAGSGRCVKIPALGEEAQIPKRVRIDSYPTQERYGWVWVFLGDLPESERPPIPDLCPEFDRQDEWRFVRYAAEANVNWQRFEENALDTAHTNFVHPTFGTRRTPRVTTVPITSTTYGGKVQRVRPAPKSDQKPDEIAKLIDPDRTFTSVTVEFSLVGVTHRIQPTFQKGMSIITISARTPIDAFRTRVVGMQGRNFLLDPQHDAERLEMIYKAVREDLAVVEAIRPAWQPHSNAEEFLSETDGMEFTFRTRVREWARRGWEIDLEKMLAEQNRKVMVIPSPERRADPTNWVHRTVPLRAPAEVEAPGAAAGGA